MSVYCLLYGMCNVHVSPLWAINKLIVCQNYFCKNYKSLMNFNLFVETNKLFFNLLTIYPPTSSPFTTDRD